MEKKRPSYAEYAYAPQGKRFLAFAIDLVIVCIISIIICFLTAGIGILAAPIVYLLYIFLMEQCCKGRTIGKMMLGLRVVDIDGKKVKGSTIMKRAIMMAIPVANLFDALSFFCWWSKKHKLHGCWHDAWTKSYVVKTKNTIEEYQALSDDKLENTHRRPKFVWFVLVMSILTLIIAAILLIVVVIVGGVGALAALFLAILGFIGAALLLTIGFIGSILPLLGDVLQIIGIQDQIRATYQEEEPTVVEDITDVWQEEAEFPSDTCVFESYNL